MDSPVATLGTLSLCGLFLLWPRVAISSFVLIIPHGVACARCDYVSCGLVCPWWIDGVLVLYLVPEKVQCLKFLKICSGKWVLIALPPDLGQILRKDLALLRIMLNYRLVRLYRVAWPFVMLVILACRLALCLTHRVEGNCLIFGHYRLQMSSLYDNVRKHGLLRQRL